MTGDFAAIGKDKSITAEFTYTDKFGRQITGYSDTDVQGASSATFPKKNFNIKLFKDSELTDKLKITPRDSWGKNNKYTLKASYKDTSFVRLHGGYRLWKQVLKNNNGRFEVTNPAKNMYKTVLAGNDNGVYDAFPIRVFLNDKFNGLYMFQQKKSEKINGIDEDTMPNAFAFGTGDNPNTPQENFTDSNVKLDGSDMEKLWNKEPATPAEIQFVSDFIRRTTREGGIKDYRGKLFSLYNQIDYVLFNNAIGNIDGDGNNENYWSYDGAIVYSGVYDLDNSLTKHYTEWHGGNVFKKLATEYDKEFTYKRWHELRESVLSRENIYQTYLDLYNEIPAEAIAEDRERWKNNAYLGTYDFDSIAPQLDNALAIADAYVEANFGLGIEAH